MPGDWSRKVSSGDPLGAMTAAAYNHFVDASKDYLRRRGSSEGDSIDLDEPDGLVLVRNDSGANVDRANVLGISGIAILPSNNLNEFLTGPILTGVTPALPGHKSLFVITYEPIQSGKVGRAFASCVCPVLINVTDTNHGFADVSSGSMSSLVSGKVGGAQILCTTGGTGTVYAVVRFVGPQPDAVLDIRYEATSHKIQYTKVVSPGPTDWVDVVQFDPPCS